MQLVHEDLKQKVLCPMKTDPLNVSYPKLGILKIPNQTAKSGEFYVITMHHFCRNFKKMFQDVVKERPQSNAQW